MKLVFEVGKKVSDYNRHVLGQEKKKAEVKGDINIAAKLDEEIRALAAYRERARLPAAVCKAC